MPKSERTAFDIWWDAAMGPRMSHSRYLAEKAWNAARVTVSDALPPCRHPNQIPVGDRSWWCPDCGALQLRVGQRFRKPRRSP